MTLIPSTPENRDGLRDRITKVLLTTPREGYEVATDHRKHRYDARCALCGYETDTLADALLAELQPAAGQSSLREQIAEALVAWTYRGKDPDPGRILETVRANAYSRADAVLSVLPASVDRAAEEAYRLALSTALRLGTGANWEAIRDRAEDLIAEVQQLNEASRRLLAQRQEMAAERFAWQERGDRAETRVRQLEASASADRVTVLREEAARIRAHCPDHLDADSADGSWMVCHCAVADELERRLAVEARDGQTTQGEAPQGVARQCVEYFLQSREADGVWEDSSGFMGDLVYAADRLAKRRNLVPGFEYRIAQRTTTVNVQPLPDCLNCRHWMCNGDGPCGALLDSWQRCTCIGPAGGAQQPKQNDADRIVAYRSPLPGAWSIYCTRHTDELGDGVIPLTSEDLPDGGLCAQCGADVLILPAPEPGP